MAIFTEDWFSSNIPKWKEVFSKYKRDSWKCLEIGSYQGRSCLWLLENINISEITCVDTFEGSPEHSEEQRMNLLTLFTNNIKGYEDKVIIKKGYSNDILQTLDESYDFIYIDGSHEKHNVLFDAVLAFDRLKPGGIMIFDDFQSVIMGYGVQIGFMNFYNCYADLFEVIHMGYQIILVKSPPNPS